MLVPLSILKKYLKTTAGVEEITQKLTDIGLEVEEIHQRCDLDDFIVAQIVDFEKHPNADKLNVCKVNNGKEILQIVCGAPNVAKNMKVVLAPIGTLIPRDNFTIKRAKIRDIESCGMMCSAAELNLGTESNGIISLPDYFIVGEKYAPQAGLNDPVLEVNLTPNRGDCASIYGVARDLSAGGIGEFLPVNTENNSICNTDLLGEIDSLVCKKFGLVKIENVSAIQSPVWMQQDLQKFGIKSRNLLVDITNYVMMVFGQPMHCFDADKIIGKISVKTAKITEEFLDLKSEKKHILPGDIVVCDERGVVSLGGIIGGDGSAVCENTKNILLEAAFFEKDCIAKTGQRLNIFTDARFRFERGTDREMIDFALDFASKIVLECLPKAEISGKSMVEFKNTNPAVINYNFNFFEQICGISLDIETQKQIISRLGLKIIANNPTSCQILPPSHRHDISNSRDIVEEILRIYGYNNLEKRPFKIGKRQLSSHENVLKLKKIVANFGYDEVITFAFQDDKMVQNVRYNQGKLLTIFNPIISTNSSMRQSILPGLLDRLGDILRKNPEANVNLFEEGGVFIDSQTFKNANNIAFTSNGYFGDFDYTKSQEKSSWHLAKTHVQSILELGFNLESRLVKLVKAELEFTHPHRAFYLEYDGKNVAIFGEISPVYLDELGVKNVVAFGEIFDIFSLKTPYCKAKCSENDLQPIYRECSFMCEKSIKTGEIIAKMREFSPSITDITLVDLYKNPEWTGDFSIALKLAIQQDNVLTSAQIDEIFFGAINAAVAGFNVKLRGGENAI